MGQNNIAHHASTSKLSRPRQGATAPQKGWRFRGASFLHIVASTRHPKWLRWFARRNLAGTVTFAVAVGPWESVYLAGII